MATPTKESPMEPQFVIEKNIPIPARYGGSGTAKVPWGEMAVGDSVGGLHRSLMCCGFLWFKRHGGKCTSHKQPDGTYRLWRVR